MEVFLDNRDLIASYYKVLADKIINENPDQLPSHTYLHRVFILSDEILPGGSPNIFIYSQIYVQYKEKCKKLMNSLNNFYESQFSALGIDKVFVYNEVSIRMSSILTHSIFLFHHAVCWWNYIYPLIGNSVERSLLIIMADWAGLSIIYKENPNAFLEMFISNRIYFFQSQDQKNQIFMKISKVLQRVNKIYLERDKENMAPWER